MVEPETVGRNIGANPATYGLRGFENHYGYARPVQVVSASQAGHTGPNDDDGELCGSWNVHISTRN